MKNLLKIIFFSIMLVCASLQLSNNLYSEWTIKNQNSALKHISWANFTWENGYLGDKYFEKTAMLIPCKISGIENPVTFQFDLGCDVSGVYENTLKSILNDNSQYLNRIQKSKTHRNSNLVLKNLGISFGDYFAENKNSYLFEKYGEIYETIHANDTIHIGTIGRDLFKNRVLIIDYPNRKFAICKSLPEELNDNLVNIDIDKYGRVILPMKLNGREFCIFR